LPNHDLPEKKDRGGETKHFKMIAEGKTRWESTVSTLHSVFKEGGAGKGALTKSEKIRGDSETTPHEGRENRNSFGGEFRKFSREGERTQTHTGIDVRIHTAGETGPRGGQ